MNRMEIMTSPFQPLKIMGGSNNIFESTLHTPKHFFNEKYGDRPITNYDKEWTGTWTIMRIFIRVLH